MNEEEWDKSIKNYSERRKKEKWIKRVREEKVREKQTDILREILKSFVCVDITMEKLLMHLYS